MKQKVNI